MFKTLTIFFVFPAFFVLCKCDSLLMYENSGTIRICNAATEDIIKEILISHNKVYIAYHYSKDLIFYSNEVFGKELFRIHLVDNNGDRKITGKGELFTDKNADHMELLVSSAKLIGKIKGIHVDEENNKLYVAFLKSDDINCEILQLDLEGKIEKKIYENKSKIQGLFYHEGMLYFSAKTRWENAGLFRFDIVKKKSEIIVTPQPYDISHFTVDRPNNKLFFRQGNQINVIDTNSSSSAYPVTNSKVVLSDSRFTGGYGSYSIAAHNRILVWSTVKRVLYAGTINKNFKFIPKKHIFMYGRKDQYSVHFIPLNLRMFQHTFNSSQTIVPLVPQV